MIDLKLAEYDLETWKFKMFHNLMDGGFLYGGKYIQVTEVSEAEGQVYHIKQDNDYYLDNKDPLNRFNGLFDGVTFGNGRFVLIINNGDIVVQSPDSGNYFHGKRPFTHEKGNLHENPELFNLIKI